MKQSSRCLDDDILYKYIDKQLYGKELKRVEHHLNECPKCLKSLSNLIKVTSAPVTEDEKKILETIEQVPIDTRLEEIFRLDKETTDQKARVVEGEPAIQKSKMAQGTFQHNFSLSRFILRPAFAFAVIVLLGVFGFGFRYYQTGYQIILAEKMLQKNFSISRNDFQLSGNYPASSFGRFLGNDSTPTFIIKADQKVKNAQKRGMHSSKMIKVQSHIFLINREFSKADSLLHKRLQGEPSALTLNDLAVSAYQQGDSAKALDYWERAYSIDPSYTQSLYNLGLYYQNQNEYQQALVYFQKSLNQESRTEWRAAIQKRIDDIQQEI